MLCTFCIFEKKQSKNGQLTPLGVLGLKKLRPAFLRSFREQLSEKNGLCEGSPQGNWDLQETQRPFPPNPNGVRNRTTTLRRLLSGADSI